MEDASTADPSLARKIELTGWSTIVLGAICIALGALEAVIPLLLTQFASELDSADDPLRGMREAWSAGSGISALVNGAFGIALIVIGVGVARRSRWAHPALEASSWASIAVLAILAKPSVAPLFAMAGTDASPGAGLLAVSVGLVVAQLAAVLWFLRFWRRPEVRAAFR
jgi:hypothetical protein